MKRKRKQANNRSLIPVYLIAAGVVLVIGVVIWSLVSQGPSAPTTARSDAPYPEVERVSLTQARAAFDQNTAVFLDVRDPTSFGQLHIPGAVNIPLTELAARSGELDPNAWIITYCT